MGRSVGILVMVMTLLAAAPARAVQIDEILSDPVLESRARGISTELRCMVCQNQSIDDLEAPLARDLRLLVRERLRAGDSDREVINFMVVRYGEFVLLKPRLTWHTAILWATPLLALLAGVVFIFPPMRRRFAEFVPGAGRLTEAERQRLNEIEEPREATGT